jgi:hypothetical protein
MENRGSRDIGEVLRDGMVLKDRIADLLGGAPKTIPELAEALEYPSHEVTYWVMEMWRYGAVVETGKADPQGYHQYKLAAVSTGRGEDEP